MLTYVSGGSRAALCLEGHRQKQQIWKGAEAMFSAEDHRPQDDVFSSARSAAWQELRHAELCEGPGEPAVLHHLDGKCLYRPRQILVQATERPALTHVANELTRRGGARDEETDSTFDEID